MNLASALDVSVESSLVDLLRSLQTKMGVTRLFITHNIALLRNMAQQVAVPERGRIVPEVEDMFANPSTTTHGLSSRPHRISNCPAPCSPTARACDRAPLPP
ncbi:UNVERIFIED_ORG: ABC-type microcin C transport system duplicated ATPase subunit YejF [Arthrobacter sp. UYEF10]